MWRLALGVSIVVLTTLLACCAGLAPDEPGLGDGESQVPIHESDDHDAARLTASDTEATEVRDKVPPVGSAGPTSTDQSG